MADGIVRIRLLIASDGELMMTAAVSLLRHATIRVELGKSHVLVDPMLDPAGIRDPIPFSVEPRRNPLVDLPAGHTAMLNGLDAVLVSHMHEDHLDAAGASWVGISGLPVLGQPEDVPALAIRGIRSADAHGVRIGELQVVRTGGSHGTGETAAMLGPVSGFVFQHSVSATSVYVAGDTVWCAAVETVLSEYQPDVIVVNAGGARLQQGDPVTMTASDVIAVARAAPSARVVAVHMDAINHCVETRALLRGALADAGVANVSVPEDGERIAH